MGSENGRPCLESPYFDRESSRYTRMARVLEYTARQHCPGWAINVQAVAPARIEGVPRQDSYKANSYLTNSQKLAAWCRVVTEAPIGSRILLIDTDTFITNPIDEIWDRDFDLAYTVRTSYMLPFNTGVMFMRVSPAAKAFVELWRQQNNRMYADEAYHRDWWEKYGGITQASFGYMMEHADHGLNLLQLPCAEWNCENSGWIDFDPGVTRIVHVKGALRRLVFDGRAGRLEDHIKDESQLMPLADRWRALEQEAMRAKPHE